MKGKSTKSALLMSFTSLLLCFAMLIGCTFAWFTDSVTSGVNKIQAGNLDIEVEYSKPGGDGSWVNLQGSESLFSSDKWEPGHTEVVYLKVKNAGTLALNYKMMVTPVTEKGGVNVDGKSFKLSDYLKFGTTTDSSVADRAAARALVESTALSLNQANLTKTGTMAAGAAEQYVTLVVYMPDTVGNDANYKTGTAAPEIELGITVVATQLQSEADSFDNTYDANASDAEANGAAEYVVGPVYDYFPQVVKSVAVNKGEDNKVSEVANITVHENNDTNKQQLASVTVPVGVLLDANANELTLKVTPQAPTGVTTTGTELVTEIADANREIANFDIKIEGVASTNDTEITVNVFVGKGLSNVKIYHNGILMTGTEYNATTGIATFKTTSFSDYTVAYDAVCARIGEETYGSLALAVAAASNGQTVTLLKSVEGGGVMLKDTAAKNITIDLDGKTYTFADPAVGSAGTETQGFHFERGNTVTVKNGTLNAKSGNANVKMLIQNYCNLTLDGVTVDGTNLNGAGSGSYVVSNNCGTVAINNSTITAATNDVAFDSCKYGSYAIPTVTVTNSTINGKIELSGGKLNIVSGNVNGAISEASGYAAGDCFITGGTFSSDPSAYVTNVELCAHKNGDVWTVVPAYAKIGSNKYGSLSEAFDAVQNGQTVEVLRNEENPVSLNDGKAYYFTNDEDEKATAIANTGLVVLINDKTGKNGQEYDYQAEGVIGDNYSICGSVEALIEKTNAGYATNTSTLKQAMGASGYTYFCLYDNWTLANDVTLQPYNACASWIYTCGGEIVIDLSGHKIDQISGFGNGGDVYATNNGWAAIEAYSGSLEIKNTKGSGEIIGARTALDVDNDASATLTSGTLTSRGIAQNHNGSGRVVAIQTNTGSFTMNGGTLQFDLFDNKDDVNAAIALFDTSKDAVVTINGGTIKAPEGKVAASTIDTSKATIVNTTP